MKTDRRDKTNEGSKALLARLRLEVERKIGRQLVTPTDFELLLKNLPHDTPLSMSTLKRLWSYVTYNHAPRESTLSVLCQFIGYRDWQHYVQCYHYLADSDFFPVIHTASDIPTLMEVELRWEPDRRCVIQKLRNGRFRVVSVENGKLQVGDEFSTMWLSLGMPMIASGLTRSGHALPLYIAGKKNGLTAITPLTTNIEHD